METPAVTTTNKTTTLIKRYAKIVCLLIIWLAFTLSMLINPEAEKEEKLITIVENEDYVQIVEGEGMPAFDSIGVALTGPLSELPADKTSTMFMSVGIRYEDEAPTENVWTIRLLENKNTKGVTVKKVFPIKDDVEQFEIVFSTTKDKVTPLLLTLDPNVAPITLSVPLAFVVLIGLYVMIIWEIVDRTFAALLASTTAISIMGWLNMRPSMETIVRWIDVDTIILLFGMMILVAILSDSGVFDYVAVLAYRITRGHPWPLICVLCMFTGILSAFLDNVTMVLLMTPVTIRLCEIMRLHVQNVLISVVIFSNIGGTMTAVGDPPNVIVASNKFLMENGVSFMSFIAHMMPIVLILLVTTMLHLRLQLRNKGIRATEDSNDGTARALKAWQLAEHSAGGITAQEIEMREAIKEKIKALQEKATKAPQKKFMPPVENFHDTLAEMEVKYPIRDKVLLIKSAIALVFAILMFFLHSLPPLKDMSLPWTAVISAFLLIILASIDDIADVLVAVEWATLLFFAALFVLMEALSHLGLIQFIGQMTVKIISSVDDNGRLAVAIIIILWVTALTSAFVDNIPITTMMVKLVIHIYHDDQLKLPLTPMVWALALGACLGGNGTLIGASANVVCAGVAEQHGYKFGFFDWFKIGFPVVLANCLLATFYLYVTEVLLKWY